MTSWDETVFIFMVLYTIQIVSKQLHYTKNRIDSSLWPEKLA